jgi:hypothetical protein
MATTPSRVDHRDRAPVGVALAGVALAGVALVGVVPVFAGRAEALPRVAGLRVGAPFAAGRRAACVRRTC